MIYKKEETKFNLNIFQKKYLNETKLLEDLPFFHIQYYYLIYIYKQISNY